MAGASPLTVTASAAPATGIVTVRTAFFPSATVTLAADRLEPAPLERDGVVARRQIQEAEVAVVSVVAAWARPARERHRDARHGFALRSSAVP